MNKFIVFTVLLSMVLISCKYSSDKVSQNPILKEKTKNYIDTDDIKELIKESEIDISDSTILYFVNYSEFQFGDTDSIFLFLTKRDTGKYYNSERFLCYQGITNEFIKFYHPLIFKQELVLFEFYIKDNSGFYSAGIMEDYMLWKEERKQVGVLLFTKNGISQILFFNFP